MLRKLASYFSSFERFIHFQYGLRRRMLEFYYKLFSNHIAWKLKKKCNKSLSNDAFLTRLGMVLKIPDDVYVGELTKKGIIGEADKTASGIYNILGSGEVKLTYIDWHIDFKSGYLWVPGKFFRKYIQESIDSNSDVKVPRELSRSHHLLNASLAYRITKDEKYARLCIDQIISWINHNPLMYSINWGCTMDVAIRAVNWIWTLGLLSGSQYLTNDKIEKIKVSLYQHGWFIWRNPEKELVYSNNHYLSDLAGQLHLGLIFTGIGEPCRWLEKGKAELFREMRLQILPSGMSYERSTHYNRLVLELIMVPVMLLKKNGHEIPSDIWYRLEKMFEFIMYTLKPDGTSPIVGDQDNGRLLKFGSDDFNDFRYLLSIGAMLFKRSDFKNCGDGFNVYCSIFGNENAFESWAIIRQGDIKLVSRAFPDAGIYICRNKDNYLMFNIAGRGLYPELIPGGHSHSDLLSFELFTRGKSFIVDPGSYVYTPDADQRMLFRSTEMHNTVTIDGESQDILCREKIWGYKRNAIPELLIWESDNDLDKVIATQNGYMRLTEPVHHERTIVYYKSDEKWVIKDHLQGLGYHTFEWFFHFDTGIDFDIIENKVKTRCCDGKNITLLFNSVTNFELVKRESFISKSYGEKKEANVLKAVLKASAPVEMTVIITTF